MKRGPKPKVKCLLPLESIAACHPTCKCEECRKVRKARHEKTRARHQARVRAGEIEVTHGSIGAYNMGCRCIECRAASADYRRMLYAHARGQQ